MSGKERIKAYLSQRQGQAITTAELIAVSGISSAARRVRELRDEEGWPIRTHTDDRTLRQDEYRLDGTPPKSSYRFRARISAADKAWVLERNGFTCQSCGAGAGDPDPDRPGRVIRLHVGHIRDAHQKGPPDRANLRALCSDCNQGARNLNPEPPSWAWLLGQIRRANAVDQRKALDWLERKFHSD